MEHVILQFALHSFCSDIRPLLLPPSPSACDGVTVTSGLHALIASASRPSKWVLMIEFSFHMSERRFRVYGGHQIMPLDFSTSHESRVFGISVFLSRKNCSILPPLINNSSSNVSGSAVSAVHTCGALRGLVCIGPRSAWKPRHAHHARAQRCRKYPLGSPLVLLALTTRRYFSHMWRGKPVRSKSFDVTVTNSRCSGWS